MLEGFALYQEPEPSGVGDSNTVATPAGTRLMRIIRLPHGWRVWTATNDFRYGTYFELFDDGRILRTTTRVDEGDQHDWVRPSDVAIRGKR
jgi:hypothetical protein